MTELHTVYALWWQDVLLYVGRTSNLDRRLQGHLADQPWWNLIERVQVVQSNVPADRIDNAERHAIARLQPVMNKQRWTPLPEPRGLLGQLLDWLRGVRDLQPTDLMEGWEQAAALAGLGVGPPRFQRYPELADPEVVREGVWRFTLWCAPGQSPAEVMARAERLTTAVGAWRLRLRYTDDDRCLRMTVALGPPWQHGLPWRPPQADATAVVQAETTMADRILFPVARLHEYPSSVLVAGTTGSGKSVSLRALICALAYGTHAYGWRTELWGLDLKRVEFAPLAAAFTELANDVPSGVELLGQAYAELYRRFVWLEEQGYVNLHEARRHPDCPGQLVVLVDELALLQLADKKLFDQAQRFAEAIAALGRAAGVQLVVATQFPTASNPTVMRTALRNNLPLRWCYRTLETAHTEKVLGDGFAELCPAERLTEPGALYAQDDDREGTPQLAQGVLLGSRGAAAVCAMLAAPAQPPGGADGGAWSEVLQPLQLGPGAPQAV